MTVQIGYYFFEGFVDAASLLCADQIMPQFRTPQFLLEHRADDLPKS